MQIKTWQDGWQYILHDAAAMPRPTPEQFDASLWGEKELLVGSAVGRASVSFVRGGMSGKIWALRHYQRGGMARFVLGDRYGWTGLEQTRPWREFHLTASLHAHGLPVPKPVAARVIRSGLIYRGDLITEFIEDAAPVADVLAWRELPARDWNEIGALIAKFQKAGVRHDDINARNILRGGEHGYFLIDFDKAEIVPPGRWQAQNLARFRRSLDKFKAASPKFRFQEADWDAVLAGYDG